MLVVATRSTRIFITLIFVFSYSYFLHERMKKHVFGFAKVMNHYWRKGQCFIVSRWLVESWFRLCSQKVTWSFLFYVCGCIWLKVDSFSYFWYAKYDFKLFKMRSVCIFIVDSWFVWVLESYMNIIFLVC